MKLLEKPKKDPPKKENQPTLKTEPIEDQFLYTRTDQWKLRMSISDFLRSNAQLQHKRLSYKI
jgi:hypothetical protein